MYFEVIVVVRNHTEIHHIFYPVLSKANISQTYNAIAQVGYWYWYWHWYRPFPGPQGPFLVPFLNHRPHLLLAPTPSLTSGNHQSALHVYNFGTYRMLFKWNYMLDNLGGLTFFFPHWAWFSGESSKLLHVSIILFFFFTIKYSIVWMHHNWFNQLPIIGHLGYF